ncbi:M48 family metallopeptidase [Rhodopirellula sp. JC740]|uniref:M48 family metallopeptidase n=1 Tax=Rhodopirellula halodulae TaxID=2894198 RepID=A0ABS8NDP9_9BACT|nr:SprT family zinc-dependent metalloprotease [Rhodopirellula sp. JC740]MCC9641680.1 M48 family metallopeptidase [Rhodopirellula sp. JC740]
MKTESYQIRVSGMAIDVDRKNVENLHLAVYPPAGRVRVAAPTEMSRDAVRLVVIDKLGWIKRQRRSFDKQARQSRREYVSGETHYVWGRRCRMQVYEISGPQHVQLVGTSLKLFVRPDSKRDQREQVINNWYRSELRTRAAEHFAKWSPIVGKSPDDWQIRRMKTKWGSCKKETKRIWLNLELAKKPPECLQYIVVHELVHLIERHHNEKFKAVLERCLPTWRIARDRLNEAPLAHEDWEY